ncbi:Leucine-rich repeat-containing protein 3B, partial [Desmophyllum pertusum]
MYASLKHVFLVLWLVVACDGACPNKCNCTRIGSSWLKVKCSGVKQVPRDIPSNTKLLYISGTVLSSIQEDSFRNLTSLGLIDLSMNLLKLIPMNAFRNLTSLKSINLNGNRIQGGFFLPQSIVNIEMQDNLLSFGDLKIILKGLKRIIMLNIKNNKIGPNLTKDVFAGSDNMEH